MPTKKKRKPVAVAVIVFADDQWTANVATTRLVATLQATEGMSTYQIEKLKLK